MVSLDFNNTKMNKFNSSHLIFKGVMNFPNQGLISIEGYNGVGKSTLLNVLNEWAQNEQLNWTLISQSPLTQVIPVNLEKVVKYFKEHYDKEQFISFNDNLIRSLDLGDDLWEKCFHEMSGGENQIVKIFLGLLLKRNAYFFDEPFLNLDKKKIQQVSSTLVGLSQRSLVVVVDHYFSIDKNEIVKRYSLMRKDINEVVITETLNEL